MTPSDPASGDYAQVTIDTPYNAEALKAFIADAERLLRINPLYHFEFLEALGDDRYRTRFSNHSNGKTVETEIAVERTVNGLVLHYAEGIKARTQIRIVPGATEKASAQLVLTDFYDRFSEQENQARLEEVDRSIESWGRDLHRYLKLWKRWSPLAPWRWYMKRVWQPMRPMARRIAFILIAISLVEIVLFLMIFVVFKLELDRYLRL